MSDFNLTFDSDMSSTAKHIIEIRRQNQIGQGEHTEIFPERILRPQYYVLHKSVAISTDSTIDSYCAPLVCTLSKFRRASKRFFFHFHIDLVFHFDLI